MIVCVLDQSRINKTFLIKKNALLTSTCKLSKRSELVSCISHKSVVLSESNISSGLALSSSTSVWRYVLYIEAESVIAFLEIKDLAYTYVRNVQVFRMVIICYLQVRHTVHLSRFRT